MHQVRPAIVLRGRSQTPHVMLFLLTALMALWLVGSLGALAVDVVVDGATGTFEYRGRTLPVWALWAASALVAAYTTRETYAGWRMTGPNHGVLDHVLEPSGLRLVRLRTWGGAQSLLVERRETVTIDAELVLQRRGGAEREYRFTVTAPGGAFRFTQAIHIEKLSLAPLDEIARDLGVVVVTSGAAAVIERLDGATR